VPGRVASKVGAPAGSPAADTHRRTQGVARRREPEAIRLPPLSSPGRGPPQNRLGREATTDCGIRIQGGGYRGPVTPGGGYRPWFTPEYLKGMIAIGQQSTDLIIARPSWLDGTSAAGPTKAQPALADTLAIGGTAVWRPDLRGSEVPHRPRSACLPAGYRLTRQPGRQRRGGPPATECRGAWVAVHEAHARIPPTDPTTSGTQPGRVHGGDPLSQHT
jgi:hypothetical protein